MTGRSVAVDLDGALADTSRLWRDWLASVQSLFELEDAALEASPAETAALLDRDAGNWRVLLERFAEDRAAVYLRRNTSASAALRALEAARREVGVFTDAPEPLARVALAHLGADRRVAAVETGEGALDRLRERLGGDPLVVHTTEELVEAAA